MFIPLLLDDLNIYDGETTDSYFGLDNLHVFEVVVKPDLSDDVSPRFINAYRHSNPPY